MFKYWLEGSRQNATARSMRGDMLKNDDYSTYTHSAYDFCKSRYGFIDLLMFLYAACVCLCVLFMYESECKLSYKLCYTATGSCHKMWPYAYSHSVNALNEFESTCLRLRVYVCACLCVCVYCVLVCAFERYMKDVRIQSVCSDSAPQSALKC